MTTSDYTPNEKLEKSPPFEALRSAQRDFVRLLS
jgi:hypothetical protein